MQTNSLLSLICVYIVFKGPFSGILSINVITDFLQTYKSNQ